MLHLAGPPPGAARRATGRGWMRRTTWIRLVHAYSNSTFVPSWRGPAVRGAGFRSTNTQAPTAGRTRIRQGSITCSTVHLPRRRPDWPVRRRQGHYEQFAAAASTWWPVNPGIIQLRRATRTSPVAPAPAPPAPTLRRTRSGTTRWWADAPNALAFEDEVLDSPAAPEPGCRSSLEGQADTTFPPIDGARALEVGGRSQRRRQEIARNTGDLGWLSSPPDRLCRRLVFPPTTFHWRLFGLSSRPRAASRPSPISAILRRTGCSAAGGSAFIAEPATAPTPWRR